MNVRVEGRDTEPLPWAVLIDEELTEYDRLDEALRQPGTVMRRYSTMGIEQADGSRVWSGTYMRYGHDSRLPDHAVAASSSPELQRFYDLH